MPDVTMCKGKGCKVKTRCYRFVAKPDEYRQAWFEKVPIEKPCPHRIRVTVTREGFVFPERKK